jgi:hypothetical protein
VSNIQPSVNAERRIWRDKIICQFGAGINQKDRLCAVESIREWAGRAVFRSRLLRYRRLWIPARADAVRARPSRRNLRRVVRSVWRPGPGVRAAAVLCWVIDFMVASSVPCVLCPSEGGDRRGCV